MSEPDSPTREAVTYDQFAALDLRVATVLSCEPHPNADRLLKLQLDVGDLGQRQVCAGVRAFYDPQQLVGRQVVVVANLKARTIRGEVSEGMVLAATVEAAEGLQDVVLLRPDRAAPAGSVVS